MIRELPPQPQPTDLTLNDLIELHGEPQGKAFSGTHIEYSWFFDDRKIVLRDNWYECSIVEFARCTR